MRRALSIALVLTSHTATLAEDSTDLHAPWDLVLLSSFNRGSFDDMSWVRASGVLVADASVSTYLTLDGTGDYAYAADNAAYSFTDGAGTDRPFSISCWIYPTTVSTAYRSVITKGQPSNYEFALYSQLNRTGNNGPCLFVYNASAAAWIGRHANTNPLSVNTWHHLVATYSGSESATGIKVYLNGAQIDDTTWSFGSYTGMTNGTAPVRLGALDSTPRDFFTGNIDGCRMLSRELSLAEIGAIYSEGRR